ncbi:hypothetical protein BDZ91DRAFT_716539 [Kalaharituber pfeilii]|nr:hypothetical protein BDZ91DRAFT_716539 [Kalaharituber pfeilii]
MSLPRRYSSSSASHDKFNDEAYARSYSPLLQPLQHRSFSTTPELSLPSSNAATSKKSMGSEETSLMTGNKVSAANANLLGLSPPLTGQFATKSTHPTSSLSHHGTGASFFLPPPAVTTFAYASSKSQYDTQRSPLFSLQQQVKALTAELQDLLDAQADGLLMANQDSPRSATNDNNTKGSLKSGRSGWDGGVTSFTLSERPKSKMSLKAARKGIIKAMRALADVKAMEEEAYAMEEGERLKNINQVRGWENRRKELQERITDAGEGEEARRVVELRKEREAVELEIRKVEAHLASLKAHHSTLLSRISSLKSTLSDRFATSKQDLTALNASQSRFFSSVPANLRNPSIAIEHWKAEAEALGEKKEQARIEHEALKEGVVEWEEALSIVRRFEEDLKRRLMRPAAATIGTTENRNASPLKSSNRINMSNRMGSPDSLRYSSPSTFLGNQKTQSSTATPSSGFNSGKPSFERVTSSVYSSGDEVPEDLYPRAPSRSKRKPQAHKDILIDGIEMNILKDIEDVLHKLEQKVQNAESKNWKLLVCCLAAEAQAFKEAREIMLKKLHSQASKEPRLSATSQESEPFVSMDETVGLKSKFGRMEIGSMRMGGSVHTTHGITGGLESGPAGARESSAGGGILNERMVEFDNDDSTQHWGDIHDFGGVGLDSEEMRQFDLEMEMEPVSGQSRSSSSQQESSSSISPKTPYRRESLSKRSRMIRSIIKHDVESLRDRSGWDREGDGVVDEDDDDDSATVKGSIQFLKSPTVGQVMRQQGSASGTGASGSGSGSGILGGRISLGLGAGWARVRSAQAGNAGVGDSRTPVGDTGSLIVKSSDRGTDDGDQSLMIG